MWLAIIMYCHCSVFFLFLRFVAINLHRHERHHKTSRKKSTNEIFTLRWKIGAIVVAAMQLKCLELEWKGKKWHKTSHVAVKAVEIVRERYENIRPLCDFLRFFSSFQLDLYFCFSHLFKILSHQCCHTIRIKSIALIVCCTVVESTTPNERARRRRVIETKRMTPIKWLKFTSK